MLPASPQTHRDGEQIGLEQVPTSVEGVLGRVMSPRPPSVTALRGRRDMESLSRARWVKIVDLADTCGRRGAAYFA